MFFPIVAAFFGILAFAPFPHLYWFAFVFLVPFFMFLSQKRSLGMLLVGTFFFRLLLEWGTVYYISEPISLGVPPLIFCGLPLSIWLLRLLYKKLLLQEVPIGIVLASLPFLWTLWDGLSAHFSPMPTAIIATGNALGASPFVGIAALGGMMGLTFFVAVISALVAVSALRLQRLQKRNILEAIVLAGVALALVFFAWFLSSALLDSRAKAYESRTRQVSVAALSVSPHVSSAQLAAAREAVAHTSADIVAFPEGFFNKSGLQPYRTETEMATAMAPLLSASTSVGAGVFNFKIDDAGKKYGRAILSQGDGTIQGVHDKARLSFIGEYWPFRSWHPVFYDWMRSRYPNMGSYAIFSKESDRYVPGTFNTIAATIGGTPTTVALLVCMEMQYPIDISWYRAHNAELIVILTSNRWLKIGKEHFLFLVNNVRRITAVGMNMPIITSGFEDVAGVFTPDGHEETVFYGNIGEDVSAGYAVFSGRIRL